MCCAAVAIPVSRAAGSPAPLERASRQANFNCLSIGATGSCVNTANGSFCVCTCPYNIFQPVGSFIPCDIVGTCNACNCTGNGCNNNLCFLRGGCPLGTFSSMNVNAQVMAGGCFGCPAPTSAPTPDPDQCTPNQYYTPVIPVDDDAYDDGDGNGYSMNPHCHDLTVCVNGANYETTPPTATSDRICGGTVASSSVSSERLSTGAGVGIGIAVLLGLAGAGVGFMYYTKSHKMELELAERRAQRTAARGDSGREVGH
jgi:hypothetical protein